jgi:hypothetical protein
MSTLRLLILSSIVLSLASGCPMSMEAPVDGGGGMDGAPGTDAPSTGTDAPATGTDTPAMMGTDAPVAPGTDAPAMMGTDAPTMMGTDGGTGVACGTDTCLAPDICCVTFAGGAAMMTCSAAADCMGVAAGCDGPEDCGSGEVCCGMRGAGGGGASTSCVPTADCGFGRLCHADTDCAGMDMCCSFMGASICSPFCRP